MADKKKKMFPPKESTSAPRRPVILRSERESREPSKDKPEKEKQPTIILKTREQSTPKEERPQSPKSLESEGPNPSKIAQHENKEKKILESKSSLPIKQMAEPVKLLDEYLVFNNLALEFLNDSSTNYLVVSIIGMQGVGKSMIMNLLALDTPMEDLCSKILNSHEIIQTSEQNVDIPDVCVTENKMEELNFVDTSEGSKTQEISEFKFHMQNIEQIEKGFHCTKGIDMYVTNNRVILLDCQALWSPSLVEDPNINLVTPRNANVVTVDCLQIASFLMSVSHVLIAVQDWFADYNFLRYIQTAEMLKPTLSASSTASSQDGAESSSGAESAPHLLVMHNRCQLEDYTPQAVRSTQDLYKKAFQKSNLQLNSGMYMYSDNNKNGLNIDNVCKGYSVDTCGTPINLFLLPEIYDDYDNREIYRGHPSFEKLVHRLRWMILGVNRHQITNVPNLSEKGWFQYCSKAWETIRKCTSFFMEYERFLP